MTSPIHQLSTDEMLSALDAIDPVDLLADELVGRTLGTSAPPEAGGRLSPWPGAGTNGGPADEFTLLEDLQAGRRCVLPTATLYVFRAAALATLAARELVTGGVITGAVLGSGLGAQTPLALIARCLSGLSHVAVWPDDEANAAMQPRVLDQLDLAGIGLTVTATVADAVFGANLIVATLAEPGHLRVGHLAKGTLLINTGGEDLPDDLVDSVDQVYVDDSALIEDHSDRYFVRMHMAQPQAGPRPGRSPGQRHRRVTADLGQVLTGGHAGRTHADDLLLVEILGAKVLDVRLACTVHRAALEQGLGVRLEE